MGEEGYVWSRGTVQGVSSLDGLLVHSAERTSEENSGEWWVAFPAFRSSIVPQTLPEKTERRVW